MWPQTPKLEYSKQEYTYIQFLNISSVLSHLFYFFNNMTSESVHVKREKMLRDTKSWDLINNYTGKNDFSKLYLLEYILLFKKILNYKILCLIQCHYLWNLLVKMNPALILDH